MERVSIGWKMIPRLAFVLVMTWMLSGCATNRIDWAPRVGNYTYDQAVVEFGPPDKQATLQDGTVVAEWLTRRGYVQRDYSPVFYPSYCGYYPAFPTYSEYRVPDYFLRLSFGPDGKLTSWKKFAR